MVKYMPNSRSNLISQGQIYRDQIHHFRVVSNWLLIGNNGLHFCFVIDNLQLMDLYNIDSFKFFSIYEKEIKA